MNQNEIQQQINDTLVKALDPEGVIVQSIIKAACMSVYRELADTFKSAGELDHYNFSSIEAQCTAHTARELGDRIKWMVES